MQGIYVIPKNFKGSGEGYSSEDASMHKYHQYINTLFTKNLEGSKEEEANAQEDTHEHQYLQFINTQCIGVIVREPFVVVFVEGYPSVVVYEWSFDACRLVQVYTQLYGGLFTISQSCSFHIT